MNKTAFAALAQYMDLLLDAICVVNTEHEFTFLSAGAERVFGYRPEEMVGCSMFDFVHPDDHQRTREIAQAVNAGDQVTHFTNRYIHKDGHIVHILWSARWSEQDRMRIAVARDISEQKAHEEERQMLVDKLELQALMDPLTELPNRALFYDRVTFAKARATREQTSFGLLYLDLDKFKQINDARGHATGDQVLVAAAQRLAGALRASDTVARLGGDEFAVVVESVTGMDDIRCVAEKIRTAMLPPLSLNGGDIPVTTSIGMAAWPTHGDTTDELLHAADQAMYRAKRGGGNQVSD